MKKKLGIIKEFGLLLLLFVSVSAVAVSEDANEVSVDITTTTSFESDGVNTVITTYDSETGLTDTSVIPGDGSTANEEDNAVTDEDDTTSTEDTDTADNGNEGDTIPADDTDSEDSGANGGHNAGFIPSDFQLNKLAWKEYADEMSDRILSMVDSDPLSLIGDFPQDLTYTINFE